MIKINASRGKTQRTKRPTPPWQNSRPQQLPPAEKRRRLEWLKAWHERMGQLEFTEGERR